MDSIYIYSNKRNQNNFFGIITKILIIALLLFSTFIYANQQAEPIHPGADQIDSYLPLLKNKRVGVFINQSSLIGEAHLVDELLQRGIHVTKIFVPEHGFRGNEDAGNNIEDTIDAKTGLPIISLYGKKFKPTPEDLQDIDILIFDIQDVGVRFYTYVSSLQKFMEAAIENDKPLIILDRPNPNGFYIDGPVLNLKYKSFTGMQPIPFIYGMTEGEYANMLIGEEWLSIIPKSRSHELKLTVIPCRNYTHKSLYELPVKPSPNLPDIQSIYWYAALGLVEATALSVGRGTDKPFQYYGHPSYSLPFTFTPIAGPSNKYPPFDHQLCHGWDMSGTKEQVLLQINKKLQLSFIITAYQLFPEKEKFFEKSFNYAAGNDELQEQIKSGVSEEDIRKSWVAKLNEFKQIRKKYLLYTDFD
jgi:uncharacterized protein YbbC (DUF1343 family)